MSYWRKNLKGLQEQPFRMLVDREWKRAKKILPILKRKPKFIWASANYLGGGVQGRCRRWENTIFLHRGYLQNKLFKEFVDTLRHEICHLPRPSGSQYSHGKDFLWWLQRLGGSRYCVASIRELAKRQKLPRKE